MFPIGKNSSGSSSRQAARSRQSMRIVLLVVRGVVLWLRASAPVGVARRSGSAGRGCGRRDGVARVVVAASSVGSLVQVGDHGGRPAPRMGGPAQGRCGRGGVAAGSGWHPRRLIVSVDPRGATTGGCSVFRAVVRSWSVHRRRHKPSTSKYSRRVAYGSRGRVVMRRAASGRLGVCPSPAVSASPWPRSRRSPSSSPPSGLVELALGRSDSVARAVSEAVLALVVGGGARRASRWSGARSPDRARRRPWCGTCSSCRSSSACFQSAQPALGVGAGGRRGPRAGRRGAGGVPEPGSEPDTGGEPGRRDRETEDH